MFLHLQRTRPLVFHRIAHPAQQADTWITRIGKDDLFHPPHADQLVIDNIGRHADQGQVCDALADDFMGCGKGN